MIRCVSELLPTTKPMPIRAALPVWTDRPATTSSWRAGPRQRDTAAHFPPYGDNRAGTSFSFVKKTPLGLAAVIWATCAFSAAAGAETILFSAEKIGTLPAGFDAGLTGDGKPGRWEVVEDAGAEGGRALAQLSAEATDYHFPLAIYRAAVATDVEATVHFKPVSGRVDQAGGVVVRYLDPNNYYLARANALENNVTFYRVVKGNRQQIASATAPVASGQWHALSLKAEGDRFSVTLDGKQTVSATDPTFTAPGRVGFWTKADSVTRFDKLDIKIAK